MERSLQAGAGGANHDDTDPVAPENILGWVVQIAISAGLRYWIHLASHGRVVVLQCADSVVGGGEGRIGV